jgi:hypothetical protein
MSRTFALLLGALALLAGCATQAPRHGPVIARQGGIDYVAARAIVQPPAEVGGLRIVERHVYPDPRYGVLYRYGGAGPLRPDVYVYPVEPLLTDPREVVPALDAQTDGFQAELRLALEQRFYDGAEVVHDERFEVQHGSGKLPVRHLRLQIVKDAEAYTSEYFGLVYHGMHVKLRLSQDPRTWQDGSARAFLSGLVAGLAHSLPPDTPGVRHVDASQGMPAVLLRMVLDQVRAAPRADTPPPATER